MNRPRIAIIGASVRAAAQSALRASCDVIAADLFADADLAAACPATRIDDYPEGFAAWLREVACDGWMYAGALENSPELIDRLAALHPLWGNAGAALRASRDPLRLQQLCLAAGIAFPDTRTSTAGLPGDGSWLCKTYASSSGAGTWRLDGESARERALREGAVFQKFVSGNPAAAIFVCTEHGAHLAGVTEQLLGGDPLAPWRYVGSIGPLVVSNAAEQSLLRLGEVLRRDLSLRGIVGVDLVLADGDATVLEINPRYTASVEVLERATGDSIVKRHVATFAGSEGPDQAGAQCANSAGASNAIHGKAVVYARAETTVTARCANQWLEVARDPLSRTMADIPRAGEHIRRGDPLLTVFAAGETVQACRQMLAQRVAAVQDEACGIRAGK